MSNVGQIEMKNRLLFLETNMQISTQFLHIVLLPDPLTLTMRVGVE